MRSTHVNSEVDFKAVDFCSVEKCNLHEYGVSEKHIETHSSCLLKMSSLVSTYPIVGMPDEMIHTHFPCIYNSIYIYTYIYVCACQCQHLSTIPDRNQLFPRKSMCYFILLYIIYIYISLLRILYIYA